MHSGEDLFVMSRRSIWALKSWRDCVNEAWARVNSSPKLPTGVTSSRCMTADNFQQLHPLGGQQSLITGSRRASETGSIRSLASALSKNLRPLGACFSGRRGKVVSGVAAEHQAPRRPTSQGLKNQSARSSKGRLRDADRSGPLKAPGSKDQIAKILDM